MAARSVRAGTVARTPEELDAWILQAPDVREPLEHGGYTTEFTASDLFPLYEVMVQKAGGPAPGAAATAPSRTGWSVGKLAAVALVITVIVVALVLALG
jgi:hypothetical protein